MEATAIQLVARRFDFSPDSAVCQHLVRRTFAALEENDRRHGIVRLQPFTVRIERNGAQLHVSLLDPDLVSRLVGGAPLGQVLRQRREQAFKQMLHGDPQVTMDDVRSLLCPAERLAGGGRLPRAKAPLVADVDQCRMNLAKLRQMTAVSDDLIPAVEQLAEPPAEVFAQLGPVIEQEGRSPELARSLISHLDDLRQRFCPSLDELAPGQLMAVALDIRDRRMSRKMRLRSQVPVRLTLYHEAELAAFEQLGPRDRGAMDALLGKRLARMLTEAYCQGGLLSMTLLGVLTHLSAARAARLVDLFETQHQLILPTPGTIHDAGTKLTHKAQVVRLHLSGMECPQIARQTFHTEEAVDRYLDDFERTLIAVGHQLPSYLLPRVLKLSKHVVQQYEALIEKHIGDVEAVRELLLNRGVDLRNEALA